MIVLHDSKPAVSSSPLSRWRLLLRGYLSVIVAIALGTLAAVPFLHLQVRSFEETTYIMWQSPADDTRLVDWGRSRPGIESFKAERRGRDVWIRWEYRGPMAQEPLSEIAKKMDELGYDCGGMRGGPSGVSPDIYEMLSARNLAPMLVGMQLAFGFVGLVRIRMTRRKGEPLPILFRGPHARAVAAGIVGGLALLALGLIYPLFVKFIFGYSPQSLWDSIGSMPVTTKMVFLIFGALGAPLAEEILFRGYLFGIFRGAGYVWFGILVSATLFAAVHFLDLYNVPAIWLGGIVLAWLYHRTKSLLASITAHAVNNTVAILWIILT